MGLPEDAHALLALPPARFVEERNALARALETRGDRAAAEVRKLRRPVGLAWVLNRLARERREDVEALLRAGDRLRAGHRRALGGEGPGELRAAEDELRDRARALRSEAARVLEEAGRPPDPAVLSRLELLLRVVAPAPGPERDAFRQGALRVEPAAASADLGGLAAALGGAAARGRGPPPRPAAAAKAVRSSPAKDAREAKRLAQHQAREAKRARAEAERMRKAARRELARAAARARRAEAAAARAEETLERASERARQAHALADAARAEVRRREKDGRGDLETR